MAANDPGTLSGAEEKKRIKEEQKRLKEENKRLEKEMKDAYALQASEESGSGFLTTFIIVLLIILIWLAFICILIRLDVAGVGSTYVRPVLKDVPVLNRILPPARGSVSDTGEDLFYGFEDMDEALERIKELELELDTLNAQESDDRAKAEELEAEVKRLETFEESQLEFEKIRNEFYHEIVFSDNSPGSEYFKTYYESQQPEKSAEIYAQLAGGGKASSEIEDYVKAYSAMKPAAAAGVFDEMTGDLQLVADILGEMSADDRGKILGLMDADIAAQVTKIMEPEITEGE